MLKLASKIKELFRKKMNDEQKVLVMLSNNQKASDDHLIALARLSFIKPETLAREAKNVQANAEYLVKMIEAVKENKK